MSAAQISALAKLVLSEARQRKLKIATAESCTGGLVGAALTDIAGSSDVYERGFITYSNDAKVELLGVSATTLAHHGGVSDHVAREMAVGALLHSKAHIAASITGVAGPGGGSDAKPVGLVFIGAARANSAPISEECRFGDIGRAAVREASTLRALEILLNLIRSESQRPTRNP